MFSINSSKEKYSILTKIPASGDFLEAFQTSQTNSTAQKQRQLASLLAEFLAGFEGLSVIFQTLARLGACRPLTPLI